MRIRAGGRLGGLSSCASSPCYLRVAAALPVSKALTQGVPAALPQPWGVKGEGGGLAVRVSKCGWHLLLLPGRGGGGGVGLAVFNLIFCSIWKFNL
jgi:hypothetical protein